MAVERIIGVDFGTSTSVIRVKRYENGKPIGEALETKEVIFGGNSAMVPTLVRKKDDDASVSYYGYEAQQKKRGFTNYHSFKVDLESTNGEKYLQARKLTEEFFSYMAKKYREQSDDGHLGDSKDKERTIISYPVKWSDNTKKYMIEAARKAGFPNVSGMDEAQAAIQAVTVMSTDHLKKHGLLKNGVASNILLIDMGAGTSDLVLCRYTPGSKEAAKTLNTWPKGGKIFFGGKEIDVLLKNFFWDKMDEADAEMVFKRIGTDKFKSWKEEFVSPALRNDDAVSDFEELDSCVDMMQIDIDEYALDRVAFEKCLSTYLKQLPELINGCLQDAGMDGSEVDLVIVTGGHSQWYFVQEMLAGKMPQFGNVDLPKIKENPNRIVSITRPQETVALGLVYSAMYQEIVQQDDTFFMPIEDVFPIPGKGITVTGRIQKGKVRLGQKIAIVRGRYDIIMASVEAIEMYHKLLDYAIEGDDVGLLLSDNVREPDVERGQVIITPGSKYTITDSFVASFRIREKDNVKTIGKESLNPHSVESLYVMLSSGAGKLLGKLLLESGRGVSILVNSAMIPAQIRILDHQTAHFAVSPYMYGPITPGSVMLAEFRMRYPTVLFPGQQFGIIYGDGLIGDGVIEKLQNVFPLR